MVSDAVKLIPVEGSGTSVCLLLFRAPPDNSNTLYSNTAKTLLKATAKLISYIWMEHTRTHRVCSSQSCEG